MDEERSLKRTKRALKEQLPELTSELARVLETKDGEKTRCETLEGIVRKTEVLFRVLLEASRDFVWITDADLVFTQVSPSVTSLLGYTVDQVVGLRTLDLLTPDSQRLLVAVCSEILGPRKGKSRGGIGSRTEALEFQRKDGSTVWTESTLTFVRDDQNCFLGLAAICRDVSDRKRVHQMQEDFISAAAHELQTPLTSIVGYSELLLIRDDLPDEEKKDCLIRINTQACKLATIISELLDVTRYESGRTGPPKPVSWPVKASLGEIVQSFRDQSRIHRFITDFPDQEINLVVDGQAMKQVFSHILSNAVKYSPLGGRIKITCALVEDRCEFAVSDRGIGMTRMQVEQIFDKLYRADTSNTGLPGLGIGMTLVKLLVEAEGGKVWVESKYGKGTTVRLVLPVRFSQGI